MVVMDPSAGQGEKTIKGLIRGCQKLGKSVKTEKKWLRNVDDAGI